MSGEEQQQVFSELIKERDKLGHRHTFAFDSLMSYPMFIAVLILMFAMTGISSMQLPTIVELQYSYMLLAVYFGCGMAAIGLWAYGSYHKAGVGSGKVIVKAHMLFMD